MSTWCAIDFETADPARDSACAVGVARVEGERVVKVEARLCRPPRGMHSMCEAVHGISWAMVKDRPPFSGVWPEVAALLNGATRLVAHNASFDKSVLAACCGAAGLAVPPVPWVCTLKLAKARWPTKGTSNKLPDVCRRLKVPFENHHDAAADAEACARVLLKLERADRDEEEAELRAAPSSWLVVPEPLAPWSCRQCGCEFDAAGRCPGCGEPPTPVRAALAEIPPAHRVGSVVALMGDAEALGVEHARCLAEWVRDNFPRRGPAAHCRCGAPVNEWCSICLKCFDLETKSDSHA